MTNTDPLSLGEGNTPVLSLRRLAAELGLPEVAAKAEWINPTGSYKDRIARATMQDAFTRGYRGWLGTSSGNGGASMAAYGSRAGLPGVLCVAADAPEEKLLSIVPYDVTLLPMISLGPSEMDELRAVARDHHYKLSITAYHYNPEGMAGAEAIGQEIVRQGDFTHVYVPAGGGGLLVAVARGMLASASTSPQLVCVQPEGCDPIVRCLDEVIPHPHIGSCTTTISGLQLPSPPDGEAAVSAVRSTMGWGRAVSDDAAWQAQDLLARTEGVFVEPASATTVAAIIADTRSGRLGPNDRPLAVLTGSGLKDLRRAAGRRTIPTTPVSLDEVRARLSGEPRP
jgi:threonine synthase